VVSALVAVVFSFAFRPRWAGTGAMLAQVGGAYAVLLVAALVWLARRHELRAKLRPVSLDITLGALVAAGLYLPCFMIATLLLAPPSPRAAWILRLYLQIGDPRVTGTLAVGVGVLALGAAEEVVWRGWVMAALGERYGERRAWLVSSALYGLAHLPTAWLLAGTDAGPNPLLVSAAVGCGLVWGWLALRFGRLAPSIFAHALFSWAVVQFPLWRL